MARRVHGLVVALALVVFGLAVVSGYGVAGATPRTYTVTTTDDTADDAPGDGVCADNTGECSLRAAMEELHAQADTDPDVIVLSSGATYVLTKGGLGDDTAALGDLDVFPGDEVSIVTDGAAPAIVTAGRSDLDVLFNDRAFHVGPRATLNLVNITVTGFAAVGEGAGVFVEPEGTLRIVNPGGDDLVAFKANRTRQDGGAISLAGAGTLLVNPPSGPWPSGGGAVVFEGNVTGGDGGAIHVGGVASGPAVDARLDLFGVVFRDNEAVDNGGAIDLGDDPKDDGAVTHTLRLVADPVVTFERNRAGTDGGAISGHATVNVDVVNPKPGDPNRVVFGQNTAARHGGAIHAGGGPVSILGGATFFANTAEGGTGGAISIWRGADTGEMTWPFLRFFHSGTDATTEDVLFYGNRAALAGGAIAAKQANIWAFDRPLTVHFEGNQVTDTTGRAVGGGAIAAHLGSEVVLVSPSRFTENVSSAYGGAIATFDFSRVKVHDAMVGSPPRPNTATLGGGGLAVLGPYTGSTTFVRSSFHGNEVAVAAAATPGSGRAILVQTTATGLSNGVGPFVRGEEEPIPPCSSGACGQSELVLENSTVVPGYPGTGGEGTVVALSHDADAPDAPVDARFRFVTMSMNAVGAEVARNGKPVPFLTARNAHPGKLASVNVALEADLVFRTPLFCEAEGNVVWTSEENVLSTPGTGAPCVSGPTNLVGDAGADLVPLAAAQSAVNATFFFEPDAGNPARDKVAASTDLCGGVADDQVTTARPLESNGDTSADCEAGAIEVTARTTPTSTTTTTTAPATTTTVPAGPTTTAPSSETSVAGPPTSAVSRRLEELPATGAASGLAGGLLVVATSLLFAGATLVAVRRWPHRA